MKLVVRVPNLLPKLPRSLGATSMYTVLIFT
jgi:hypothetical protein